MTARLLVVLAAIAVVAVIVWLCTRGYYRAAYGDRYECGYADGQAEQIRAYQDHRTTLPAWREARARPAPWPPQPVYDPRHGDRGRLVLGASYPLAAGPPRYSELSPEALDGGPPTSEWARDLIAGIESWNATHLTNGDPLWHD